MVHGYSMSLAIMAWHVASSIVHTVCTMLRSIDSVCVNVNLRALFQLPGHTSQLTAPRHTAHRGVSRAALSNSIERSRPRAQKSEKARRPAPPCLPRDRVCVCVACLC